MLSLSAQQAGDLVLSTRAGDLQRRLLGASPQRSIGPAVREKANESQVSVEGGLVSLGHAPRSRTKRTISGLPAYVAVRTADGGLPPRERRRQLLDDLVPRTREPALGALFRKRLLAVPLAAGQLVVDLEAVPVGIREVDADRDGVVRDADGNVLGLEPLIHFREILEAPHSPRDVVQAYLLLLRSRGVFAHFEEGDVVSVARVAREEGRSQLVRSGKGHGVLGVEPEDVRIPPVRALGVAHEDVDVVEGNGLVAHVPGSCEQIRVSAEYTAPSDAPFVHASRRSRR